MKILHVVPSYFPAERYGGPIRAVHELASATARRGHAVEVFTTNVDGPGISDVPVGVPVDRDGVRVWYFPSPVGRRIYYSPAMGRKLRSSVNTFDVVHMHSVFLYPTWAAARAARQSGVPYVVAPHGMLVADLIRRKSGTAKGLAIALFERRNIAGATAVHVTSQGEADDLLALGLQPRKIVIVPNGVAIQPADRPGTVQTPDHAPQIIFLGRINWKKGLDRLIPALALVPKAILILAGNDEEGYTQRLREIARDTGVVERVAFVGPVADNAKWDFIRKARLLVLPSYSENSGLVVLEAMAVGVPVVVTREVGLAPVVAAAKAGIVCDGSPELLAAAINEVLADARRAAEMGAAGRHTAQQMFSWDIVAEKIQALYDDIRQTENLRA
jgi:glycosyltransferase involved in cell wall biosynthesis